jgi:hypothetical protein
VHLLETFIRNLIVGVTYLYQQMPIYIKISNYITNAPACFGASTPSSESFDIAFAKVIKLLKLH